MKNELLQKKLTYGIFLGMAISSRFLLSSKIDFWAQALSMLLLFFLISAVLYWLRQLRELLPEKQLTMKTTVLFTFQLFLIAAIFSSIVKFCYFQYLKPSEFQTLINQSAGVMQNEMGYPPAMVEESMALISPALVAFMSAIFNTIGGTLLGFVNWFFFKKEQELKRPKN